jgi:hypothetical protein
MKGLLFLFLGDYTQAKTFVKQALDVYVENLVRCRQRKLCSQN